jgi:uncharacterized protein YjbJ (UPF0337 family)
MLKVADLKELTAGVADKTVGLALEIAGTVAGNERLKQAGRERQDAGAERLMAVEEEAKATSRAAEAKAQESRQKSHQPASARSPGRDFEDQDSAAAATAERIKGYAKKGFATVTGNEEMKAEADAQREKAEAQGQAAKHDLKAETHRQKAEASYRTSERERRSS